METVWFITTLILFVMFLILGIYHIYYRVNIRNITRQVDKIMAITDTNQLLTVAAKQRDIVSLAGKLNKLIENTRNSELRIRRTDKKFRQSIINISHDLRTPLTTAGGYVQMLQTDVTEEERQSYLSIILERQNMVNMLLNQLFEYVRIESGEITYEMVQMDAKRVFVETLAMYYDDFNKRKQEPSVHILDGPCMIQGDEQGVKRIFSNIINNALIHGVGGYQFEIKETNGYEFICSNECEPMTKEDTENLFERFYTKDPSRSKKTTGLGLAIAKEIVKRMNGKIEAEYGEGILSIRVFFPPGKTK